MKKMMASVVVLFSLLTLPAAKAQLLFNEGQDYQVLPQPLPLQKAGENEVVEFFSYTCPHCYNLEPALLRWVAEKKPENVGFYPVHVVGGSWTLPATVKYTAAKLGLGKAFDQQYFAEFHKNRNRRVANEKTAAINFIAEKSGIDKAEVEKAWNSLQVKSALKRSHAMMEKANIQGVPAVVVNGKYLVQLTEYQRFFSVIEFLLATKGVAPLPTNATEKTTEEPVKSSAVEAN